jgi:hypothetical protein
MKHKTHTKKYTSARKLARGGPFGRHILTSCHQMSLRDVYFSRYVDVWDVLVTRIQPTCRIADTRRKTARGTSRKRSATALLCINAAAANRARSY